MNVISNLSTMLKDHREKVDKDKKEILFKEAQRKIDISYSLGIICLSVDGLPVFRVVDEPSSADELTPSQAEAKVLELRNNYVTLHLHD